jgi:hypothetical protein
MVHASTSPGKCGKAVMPNQHADLVEKLDHFTQALAEGPKKGMFRCEDMISAAAALVGECCLRNSAVFDFDHHDLAPGRAIFSDKITGILSGDRANWQEIPLTSVFGVLYFTLTRNPKAPWNPGIFPDVAEIYRHYAAARGSKAPAVQWGYVPLTSTPAHAPTKPPLRAAFELRCLALKDPTLFPGDLLSVSQSLLIKTLIKVRSAIDDAVAIRLALETMNGMAKMAPVLPRHMQEFAAAAKARA